MMKHYFFCLCLSVLILVCGCASRKASTAIIDAKNTKLSYPVTDSFMQNLLGGHPQYFDSLIKNNSQWRIQVIYTQIDRDKDNKPSFSHHFYNLDHNRYYYPASTVKMPVALLALQKLHELKIQGLDRNATMITEAAQPGQTSVYNDPTNRDGRPTIDHYIRKIFLVSDNDAFNRLYEFLGQEYINNSLHRMGYDSAQILHRLQVNMTEEQHRNSNPVKFFDTAAKLLYSKPAERSNLAYQQRSTFMGRSYKSGDNIINKPFDFSRKNRLALSDLHSILQSVIFPESVPAKKRFQLSQDDYSFVYRYMSMKPGESKYPQYDSSFTDAYAKLLLFGGKGPIPPEIRSFNKEGDAYGFLTDAAYIVDFKNGVEFLLSATIHCNSDGIFNDDKYDYNTVGLPFLKHLGEVIYQHELKRPKKQLPDLSRFKMEYTN